MARLILILLTCALGPAAPGAADILMPGTRAVRHELVLEPGTALDGWTLVATPVRGFGGVTVIVPGEPFTFSSKYGTRIYALDASASVPEDPDGVRAAARAACDPPVTQVASAPLASPLARVLTTLRLASIDEGRILLEVVGEQRFDAAGREDRRAALLALLALVALVGVAAVAVLGRRVRAARAA